MKTPTYKSKLTNIFQQQKNTWLLYNIPKIAIHPWHSLWKKMMVGRILFTRYRATVNCSDVPTKRRNESESPWPMPAPTSKAYRKRPLAFPRTRAKRLRHTVPVDVDGWWRWWIMVFEVFGWEIEAGHQKHHPPRSNNTTCILRFCSIRCFFYLCCINCQRSSIFK